MAELNRIKVVLVKKETNGKMVSRTNRKIRLFCK